MSVNAALSKLSHPVLALGSVAFGCVGSAVFGAIMIPSGPDYGGAKRGQPHTTSKQWYAQTKRYLQFQNCDPITNIHR
eukprot:CAMPEP_0195507242 /NCGR_PEP_ID=MMETSP0794_2-20130614/731_1 /TAXON_ID=515487 /ORGANISM="Stephanopyxis turris, Strain CCMP 815" /LENGTH=77 /DNA_ID=CAMNT_0040633861 /DNA_START=44 /DNA_END=277 /DNA_ORIENTATION=-